MTTLDKMPPIVQNWAEEIANKANPIHVRYNYFMQFKALSEFATAQVNKYQAQFENVKRK